MTPESKQHITAGISQALEVDFAPAHWEPVYGGDINRCFTTGNAEHRFFVKTNRLEYLPMLQTECSSLQRLGAAGAMKVPAVITLGNTNDCAFLVLEYCSMHSHGDGRRLAQGLVNLHKTASPDGRHGWHHNNYIGTSLQSNQWHRRWHQFWLEQRLQPQLELAYGAGFVEALRKPAEQLKERLPDILRDHSPEPSLLHGDLWGGNAAFLHTGEPVVYDPASYYGDRETDLALTELFGGFSPEFYQEYQRLWPLNPGYDQRKRLYNLYHLLNHLNLFGAGYLSQCLNAIANLLDET